MLYRGGVATQLDRLDAERSSLLARQAVVQLRLAQLPNAVLLYACWAAAPGRAPDAGGPA